MGFADDVSDLLIGTIVRSSEKIVIIINDWMLGVV